MIFHSIIPILYSHDVKKSIRYYTEILGFASSWSWDEPVTFGGVDMGEVRIFFCKDGQGQKGTWLAINVTDVDAYYQTILARGAKIISQPQSFEWGMREMLVEDPDGHRIRFGHGIGIREKSAPAMPDHIAIVSRTPTAQELKRLVTAAGWSQPAEEAPPTIPQSAIAHTVVAENKLNGEVIGCAFLLTDHAGFYYIKNVIVHPHWQGKRIGTALVKQLDDWLNANAPDQSMAALHTGDYLAPFYRQFGFTPAFSMQKRIRRGR